MSKKRKVKELKPKIKEIKKEKEEVEESELEEEVEEPEIEVEEFKENLARVSSISVSPVLKSEQTLEKISGQIPTTFGEERKEGETKPYEEKSERLYETPSTRESEERKYEAPSPIGIPTEEKPSASERVETREQENLRRTLLKDKGTLGQERKEFEDIERREYLTEEEKKRKRYMM